MSSTSAISFLCAFCINSVPLRLCGSASLPRAWNHSQTPKPEQRRDTEYLSFFSRMLLYFPTSLIGIPSALATPSP
jgi:hypothetical protein